MNFHQQNQTPGRTSLRLAAFLTLALVSACAAAQGRLLITPSLRAADLPDAPLPNVLPADAPSVLPTRPSVLPDALPLVSADAGLAAQTSSSLDSLDLVSENLYRGHLPIEEYLLQAADKNGRRPKTMKPVASNSGDDVDAKGDAIPVSRQQPKRILGLLPNYRSVTGGAVPPPPSFRYNFKIATRQAFDYSSFVFLGITSLAAEGLDEHPALGKGIGGFYAYTWRGFLDKTDGTYLQTFVLPSILHEDGRYYAVGEGSKWKRVAYASSRVVITRTYGGRNTFNFAGIGGKVLTQVISRTYYPTGSTDFGTLAEKFTYAIAREVGFTILREFYPDIAVHVLHRHP